VLYSNGSDFMRILLAFILLPSLFAATAAVQSDTQDRPTLNRHGAPPNATPTPATQSASPPASPAPAAAPSPSAAEPAQPNQSIEPPQPAYPDLLHHFDNDSHAALETRETDVQKRGNVRLIELNYAGDSGDRVPAYLLIPSGNGPFPAIIWGHWLKKDSPLANKDEFLEEALVLARSGVVSLLIDAPQARHDWAPEKGGPLEQARQQSDAAAHQVIDLRRAVDLLYLRQDVDRKRIAYVGHSWDAHVGAILAGVETRISAFVLMASGYADQEEAFASKDPQRMAQIKEVGEDNVREYFREYAFDDPVYFLGHTDRESIFLQFASGDGITREQAQKYLNRFSSKDKKMEFYDAGHALNSAARLDRDRWLQKHLGVKKIDEKELEEIPQLK
jgi:dienelactone hydrolase